jgi:hypothetical protein
MGSVYNEEGTVNITKQEFEVAVLYATERLRSLRGQLDLHDGGPCNMTSRASLRPVSIADPATTNPSDGPSDGHIEKAA